VKRPVFVDTAWLVALVDHADDHHARALDLATVLAEARTLLVTTDAVLIELANYFARGPLRMEAISWIGQLRAAPEWDIVPLARDLLARAEQLYRRHDDKNWSVTDCIGMEVMRDRGIRDAATTDAGFRQAGFRTLLTAEWPRKHRC
jgi:predicted nucleic acid-binding protein